MNPSIFLSVEALARRALDLAGRFETVSLDLFDTVAVRRMADPDSVKAPVARFVSDLAAARGVSCRWQDALQARSAAESEHRARNRAANPDAEARYREFMADALKRIFGAAYEPALLDAVSSFEMRLERAMLVPRAAMLDLMARLRAMGKRVILITDIYLTSDLIRAALDGTGVLEQADILVSSADSLRAKASGAAFPMLRDRLGLDFARWLHIGDNAISDGARPASFGIAAMVLRDASERFRKAVFRRYERSAARRPFWQGRLVQQLMLPLEAENTPRDLKFALGFSFFGPLVCAFVQHVAERAAGLGARRVYFFAREGGTFLAVWRRLEPWLFPASAAPEGRYLHVSRLALAPAACARRGLTHSDAHLSLLPAGSRDMRDVCRVFGLSAEAVAPHLARFGLSADTPLNSHHGAGPDARRRLDALLSDKDFQDDVRRQTAARGLLVEKYLEQEEFFRQPDAVVVDMGWLGTIQRFLDAAIAHRPDRPRLHGIMFGATRGIPFPERPDNRLEGFIFDRARFDFASACVTYALDLFEESCRAPHPSVAGYRERGGCVEPVLAAEDSPQRRVERRQDEFFAPVREGILAAADRFGPAVAMAGCRAADLKPWLNHLLLCHMAFPRASEMRALRPLCHFDDFGGGHKPGARVRWRLFRMWDLDPRLVRACPPIKLVAHFWGILKDGGLP